MKTKIKSHGDEDTDFYNKKFIYTCLAVISLDSTLKRDDNYYPQVFLKECKYIDKKVVSHIDDKWSHFFSSSSDESDKNKLEWVNFFCRSIAT